MDFIKDYLKAQGLTQSEVELMSDEEQQHIYNRQRARGHTSLLYGWWWFPMTRASP